MWCARCGRDDTELVWVMTSSRKTVLPMCADDRSCYPKKEQKNTSFCRAGVQSIYKNKLQVV
jgi:hypothetical protein